MRLLDLFCGAGGAAMGYSQAGFTEIVGIDIAPQKNYPFTFIRADALQPPVDLEDFDLIHASPPCQDLTTMNNRTKTGWGVTKWPDLIVPTRDLLASTGVPSVLENVPGARSSLADTRLTLTGEQFGLRVYRPRLFELNGWWALAPPRVRRQADPVAVYGKEDLRRVWTRVDGSELRSADLKTAQDAMGIDWMTWDEIREAIPTAYTKFIGEQFLAQLAVGEML